MEKFLWTTKLDITTEGLLLRERFMNSSIPVKFNNFVKYSLKTFNVYVFTKICLFLITLSNCKLAIMYSNNFTEKLLYAEQLNNDSDIKVTTSEDGSLGIKNEVTSATKGKN